MPSRPRLIAGALGDEADAASARRLAEAASLGLPQDPDWVESFMKLIFERDFDGAREVLRKAVSRGVSLSMAEQYAKVLEDFLRRRDEAENPQRPGEVGECRVMVKETGKDRGRGLVVPAFMNWGDMLWNERPLAYIQSPCNQRAVQACTACLAPVGTLASQLRHMGLDAPAGAEAVGAATERSPPGLVVPCSGASSGCAAVFCSESCRDWALREHAHALLCAGRLPGLALAALQRLTRLAEESDTEHLLLLAHSVAQMVLLLQQGEALDAVLHQHVRQFVSAPWESLAAAGAGADASDTPEARRALLARARALLEEVFSFVAPEIRAPLLEMELLSSLMGVYELVTMCICIPHPLNSASKECQGLLAGTDLLARVAALQQAGSLDSDTEGEEEDGDESGDDGAAGNAAGGHPGQDGAGKAVSDQNAVDSLNRGALFAIVVGSALVPTIAYTNHACLPNCNIDFATAGEANCQGPGLWVQGIARRPLLPGDEVLMAYVPSVVGKPLAYRQRKMREFGFTCRCRSCLTDEMLESEDVPLPRAA